MAVAIIPRRLRAADADDLAAGLGEFLQMKLPILIIPKGVLNITEL